MSNATQWIAGCATAVLLLGILIGGPAACSIRIQQEATRRVTEVCSGDLKSDGTRAAACIMAIRDAKTAGL